MIFVTLFISVYLFNDILYIGILLLFPVYYYCVFSFLGFGINPAACVPPIFAFVAFPGGVPLQYGPQRGFFFAVSAVRWRRGGVES